MTSFAFVFVLVPEPVWKMSSGKCSSSLPSTTSSAAWTMSALRSASSRPKVVIGLRGRPFQQAKRANEGPRKTPAAHRKIQDRALGRRAVESEFRDGHFAHRILFDASLAGAHAVTRDGNSAVAGAALRPWPLRVCAF